LRIVLVSRTIEKVRRLPYEAIFRVGIEAWPTRTARPSVATPGDSLGGRKREHTLASGKGPPGGSPRPRSIAQTGCASNLSPAAQCSFVPPDPRVLVVCSDISQSDRIVEELSEIGLEPSPAFSAGEAVGRLVRESFDAVVVDQRVEEGMPNLRRWLKAKYSGVVVLLPEGEPVVPGSAGAMSLGGSSEVTRRLSIALTYHQDGPNTTQEFAGTE